MKKMFKKSDPKNEKSEHFKKYKGLFGRENEFG